MDRGYEALAVASLVSTVELVEMYFIGDVAIALRIEQTNWKRETCQKS